MKKLHVILLGVLMLVLAGCGRATPHVFDGTKVSEGTMIAGMRVVRNETHAEEGLSSSLIQFSGRATISGTYAVVEYDELWRRVQFTVGDESLSRIPRLENDPRTVWFVFNNQDDAQKAFGAEVRSGKATVVIDNYRIHLAQTDTFNTADLVRVVRMGQ